VYGPCAGEKWGVSYGSNPFYSSFDTSSHYPASSANPENGFAPRSKAGNQAGSEAGGQGSESGQAGLEAVRESGAASSALQVVPAGLGRDRGNAAQRTGNALCLPVLPDVAPGGGSSEGIQTSSPRAVDQDAPRGRIRIDAAFAEKRTVH
jgi:hypothetical protein